MKKGYQWEILYQLAVIVVLFSFFSFHQQGFDDFASRLAFFSNYMAAAMAINYLLLPKLYYKNKIITFFVAISLLVVAVILVDEFILEQIYFPTTRGTYFPGVFFSLMETLPIILIFVAFKLAWDFNRKQREIENLKVLVKENEVQFLKSQINPHFLFNNLNNLYSYAIENSPKTPSIILEFSSVLRYMLYDCRSDQVNLINEINHLKDYTGLNELRIEDRGTVNFETNIDKSGYTIAPLILMVFIENAFKHTTSSQLDNIFIDVAINVDSKGVLNFTCRNSFLPQTNTDNLANGIGLVNVKKQLSLLYPSTHTLSIQDENNIYEVNLSLVLKPVDHA